METSIFFFKNTPTQSFDFFSTSRILPFSFFYYEVCNIDNKSYPYFQILNTPFSPPQTSIVNSDTDDKSDVFQELYALPLANSRMTLQLIRQLDKYFSSESTQCNLSSISQIFHLLINIRRMFFDELKTIHFTRPLPQLRITMDGRKLRISRRWFIYQ